MMVNIIKAFMFQHPPRIVMEAKYDPDSGKMVEPERTVEGEKVWFDPGIYDLPEEVAGHWMIRAHTEGYRPPPPDIGSPQYAQQAALAQQAVRMMQPVTRQGQQPAPLPPGVSVASRSGMVSDGAHYFAGNPQVDRPLPGSEGPQGAISWGPGVVGVPQSHAASPSPPNSASPHADIPPFPLSFPPPEPQE
jgi:hypothetical protein